MKIIFYALHPFYIKRDIELESGVIDVIERER